MLEFSSLSLPKSLLLGGRRFVCVEKELFYCLESLEGGQCISLHRDTLHVKLLPVNSWVITPGAKGKLCPYCNVAQHFPFHPN